jgi:predicted DNA-binding transcriptional regulator AlpA
LAKSRLTGTGPRFVKVGRAVRYAESAVREFIKARGRSSTSEA